MNINKILEKILGNQYNIQEVLNCCRLSIRQLKNLDKICTLKNFLTYLILNLNNTNHLLVEYKYYYTKFNWNFTIYNIIVYSILAFYDLKNINITERKFVIQFQKELEQYSIFNAEDKLEYLIDNKIIRL